MAKETKTLDAAEKSLRDIFDAQQAELEAHDAADAPLRAEMDKILEQIAALDKQMEPLAQKWRARKGIRFELANKLARSARGLPGNHSTSDAA